MRNVLLASAALLGLGFAGHAMASDSVTTITQSASNSSATQDVTGNHNTATASQNDAGSVSFIANQTQKGDYNSVTTTQRGGSFLTVNTAQTGNQNTITSTQSSGGRATPNDATLAQTGDRNTSTVTQTGGGNTLTARLTGNGNTTTQNQQAYGSTMTATVNGGDANKITQNQYGGTRGVAGTGNSMITYIGGGSSNSVDQRQNAGSTNNHAETDITGNYNTAAIFQSGMNSIALQQQFNTGDRASITQGVGTGNAATQRQH